MDVEREPLRLLQLHLDAQRAEPAEPPLRGGGRLPARLDLQAGDALCVHAVEQAGEALGHHVRGVFAASGGAEEGGGTPRVSKLHLQT